MGLTSSLNSKANVKQNSNNDLPFSAAQPVIASYYATSTASQTVINLPFTIVASGTSANTDIFWLFVDGKKLDLGASNDYQFTSIAADSTSAQVTLNFPIASNLNIQAFKLGLKKESEFLTDNRFTQLYNYMTDSFQGYISPTETVLTSTTSTGTPVAGTFYSSITGRTPLMDLSQDLKPRFGISRIMTPWMQLVTGEYGPSGQPVNNIVNDTLGQIRVIGGGWGNFAPNNTAGYGLATTTLNDYAEVTFYGTGLNVIVYALATSITIGVQTDGVTGTSVTTSTEASGVQSGAGYGAYRIYSVVQNLALGVHTVTLTLNSGSTFDLYGVETVSQLSSGSTSVFVQPGTSNIRGQRPALSARNSFAYNASSVGTTGGRVVIYQNSDGSIGTGYTQNATSPSYMGSASHTNEELVRTYGFRDFGYFGSGGLASSISGTNFSTTLDDDSTCLNVSAMATNFTANGLEYFTPNTSGSYMVLNFIGTGLDIYLGATGAGTFDNHTVYVDGVQQSTTLQNTANDKIVTIASGLPYGSHSVQISRPTATNIGLAIYRFLVYQPKTASIPTGAVKLGAYNILANYSQATFSVGSGANNGAVISQGTIRKMNVRENILNGTWAAAQNNTAYPSGMVISTSTAASNVSFTFFGTGITYMFANSAGAQSFTVSVDGSTNLTGFTTNLSATAGLSFTASTGVVTGSPAASAFNTLSISNMTLGVHTIKVTWTSGLAIFPASWDVSTPIHAPRVQGPSNGSSAILIGSQGVSDDRNFTPGTDIPHPANYTMAYGVASGLTVTSTTPIPMQDLFCNITTRGGPLLLNYSIGTTSEQQIQSYQLYVDGNAVGTIKQFTFSGVSSGFGSNLDSLCDTIIVPVAAGQHRVQVYWYASSGGTIADVTYRNLTALEII